MNYSALVAAIDWSKCYVGGSFALWRATGADKGNTWRPEDIDIFCETKTHAEFDEALGRLMARLGTDTGLEKKTLITEEMRKEALRTKLNGRDERFHETIIATSTMHSPRVSIPFQLVGVKPFDGIPLLSHLESIVDLPTRVFMVGEDIMPMPAYISRTLRERRIPRLDICPSRVEKYRQRGYDFE